jgi:Heterokaryon incompatibility protein (HET)
MKYVLYNPQLSISDTNLSTSDAIIGTHKMSQQNEDHLCASCSKLDFQRLFFACEKLDRAKSTRSLKAIREATNCPFCRLTLNALISNPDVQNLQNASCTMRSEELGTVIRSKPNPNSAPTLEPWTLSDVEEMCRALPSSRSTARYSMFKMTHAILKSLGAVSGMESICENDLGSTSSTDLESTYATRLGPTISRLWFTLSLEGKEKNNKHDKTTIIQGIQIAASESVKKQPKDALLRGRKVNLTFDIGLLNEWLETCMYGHGATCCPRGMPGIKGFCFRLIDINRRCVVRAPFYCRYVALSYVWGAVKQLQLRESTINRLTTDGSLSNDQSDIPRTLKDALYLCELIGQRYLWIDALCIKQDDEEDKAQQINKMGLIYSCAELTIVSAAGSDANGGLPGLRAGSRTTQSHVESLAGLQLMTAQRPFLPCISDAKWESRGWTFQEKILSQRLVIFTEDQVFFHCNAATWFEDTILENPDPGMDLVMTQDRDVERFSKPAGGLQFFETYETLVKGFSSRNFTDHSDVLNAFNGIEHSLIENFGDTNFIYGLPEASFEEALRWKSPGHFPDRRLKKFPSWSWMGWRWGEGFSVDFDPPTELSRGWPGDMMWHRVSEGGGYAVIAVNDLANLNNDLLSKHLQPFWSKVKKKPFHYSSNTMPPLPHLISGCCRVVPLTVDYNGIQGKCRYGCDRYAVRNCKGGQMGEIDLNIKWRKAQPAELDFVELGKDTRYRDNSTNGLVYTILVEWQDGIAYRVQRPVEPFDVTSWKGASQFGGGCEVLVTLG